MKKIDLKPAHTDERGVITDLLQDEEINAVTIISFAKGAVRANHYHKETYQWNYVLSGKIKIITQLPNREKVETLITKSDFVVTVPGESHALMAVEQSELLVLTKGPRGGDNYENDTFRLDYPL
ncbi:MAG: cupin domain-containing protein [Desulfobacterales bacterium]|nr:cupin domain-containing protein [Desulfobacterales bacterium]